MERGDDRRRRQRRLHGEDRAPVERLREDAAQRGPDRGSERCRRRPRARSRAAVSAQDDEQRQRRGEKERGPDPLGDPPADEHSEAVRDRAHDRGHEEDAEPREREPGGPNPPQERQQRERADDDREVVGGDDPGDLRDGRLQLEEELGQREDDDRGVRERDRDRDDERDLERKAMPGCGGRDVDARQPSSRSEETGVTGLSPDTDAIFVT